MLDDTVASRDNHEPVPVANNNHATISRNPATVSASGEGTSPPMNPASNANPPSICAAPMAVVFHDRVFCHTHRNAIFKTASIGLVPLRKKKHNAATPTGSESVTALRVYGGQRKTNKPTKNMGHPTAFLARARGGRPIRSIYTRTKNNVNSGQIPIFVHQSIAQLVAQPHCLSI